MSNQKGFSLTELMLAGVLVLIIMGGVYTMIVYYKDVSGTEQARVRQMQESRFLLTNFSHDLKNAGAVLTLTHTSGFLSIAPYFNGIFPINNTDFPDGIIVATGDPNAVTKLTAPYTPTSDGNEFAVDSTATAIPVWQAGDKVMLLSQEGYYIFSVNAITANSITRNNNPVYFSGMLATSHYVDTDPNRVKNGEDVTFVLNTPVIRLAEFSIYLVRERFDNELNRNVRELMRVTDANGDNTGNFLSDASTALKHVVAENIWDIQISYLAYPLFPDTSPANTNSYFASSSGGVLVNLLEDIRTKTLKDMRISVVALTDEYPGKGETSYTIPQLADHTSQNTTPQGKYSFRMYTLSIEPRNYNTII